MQHLGEGADIVGLMKESVGIDGERSDFSDVFLFFDLDIHNQNQDIEHSKTQLKEMLEYFDNETENGKLYVNYPMIESIYHTDRLPDPNYSDYTVDIDVCSEYKRIAREFGPYASLDHLCINERKLSRQDIVRRVKTNWLHLVEMNVDKSAKLCDVESASKNIKAAIAQNRIFENQDRKHILPKGEIAILNSFPLFLYDYFKPEALTVDR